MRRHFKQIICLILCLVTAFSFSGFFIASAVSIKDGKDALEAQWKRGAGPEVDTYSIDYSYYSPVKKSSDKTKYPLVVLIGGASQGSYQGKEIKANEFTNWSSSEYQSRFAESKGAYILIARSPEEKDKYWSNTEIYPAFKAALDDFVKKNSNVDTDRIYIGGWCLGGSGAQRMASRYSDFFAGVIIMAPFHTISLDQIDDLRNMAVWVIGCKADVASNYAICIGSFWERLKATSTDLSRIRLTTFDTAPEASPYANHNVWLQASYDMHYTGSGYTGMQTIDGMGKKISNPYMISWLSSYSKSNAVNCTCQCHSLNMITRLVWQITNVIYRILGVGSKQYCGCGKAHW